MKLSEEKCTGCGMCVNVCPHEVFVMNDKKVQIIDRNRCMECGACAKNCPVSALNVESGVGCAYAIIIGKLFGNEQESCCTDSGDCC